MLEVDHVRALGEEKAGELTRDLANIVLKAVRIALNEGDLELGRTGIHTRMRGH